MDFVEEGNHESTSAFDNTEANTGSVATRLTSVPAWQENQLRRALMGGDVTAVATAWSMARVNSSEFSGWG